MRALLVDDEPLAREELRMLLAETGAFEIVGECANAIDALAALRREEPDVLFLDVQMPVVDGFELLGMIEDDALPAVVFVTAHDEFALRAFDANAADYLLKPVSRQRLAQTVEKLRKRPEAEEGASPGERPAWAGAPLHRIPCSGTRAIKLIPVSEVEYVKSGPAGVYVVVPGGEYFTELTLKVLEERAGLVRCHKQFLVNIDRVDEIANAENQAGILRTRCGHEVPASRRHLAAVRQRLGL